MCLSSKNPTPTSAKPSHSQLAATTHAPAPIHGPVPGGNATITCTTSDAPSKVARRACPTTAAANVRGGITFASVTESTAVNAETLYVNRAHSNATMGNVRILLVAIGRVHCRIVLRWMGLGLLLLQKLKLFPQSSDQRSVRLRSKFYRPTHSPEKTSYHQAATTPEPAHTHAASINFATATTTYSTSNAP